jgi:hypothetical protein
MKIIFNIITFPWWLINDFKNAFKIEEYVKIELKLKGR